MTLWHIRALYELLIEPSEPKTKHALEKKGNMPASHEIS